MSLSLTSIILLIDIVVFSIFWITVLVELGIPENLSITYYKFDKHKKGLQWFFPIVSLFLCLTAIPIWILTTYHASGWRPKLVVIPTFAFFCMLAVTFSANYKKNQSLIHFHYTSAIIASVCLVVWINLVAFKLAYIDFTFLLVLLYAAIRTKTLKQCSLFWLETAAFYSLLVTLLLIDLIPIQI